MSIQKDFDNMVNMVVANNNVPPRKEANSVAWVMVAIMVIMAVIFFSPHNSSKSSSGVYGIGNTINNYTIQTPDSVSEHTSDDSEKPKKKNAS